MKQKMSTADVAGEVACLRQRILGMRLANIYDVNSKVCTFIWPAACGMLCAVDSDLVAVCHTRANEVHISRVG